MSGVLPIPDEKSASTNGQEISAQIKAVWKKTRQVIQTAAEPPKIGTSCRAAIGSMRNSRKDEKKYSAAK